MGGGAISTAIMTELERWPDPSWFTRRDPGFLAWRSGWPRPPGTQWLDSEWDIWHRRDRILTPRHRHRMSWDSLTSQWQISTVYRPGRPCLDLGSGPLENPHWPGMEARDTDPAMGRPLITPAWYSENRAQWSAVWACCSLHFGPRSQVARAIGQARSLLSAGGQLMVALNRARIADGLTPGQLTELPEPRRAIWFDQPGDAALDGNVWLWYGA